MFSAKILFFLITSTLFLQYTSQKNPIRGRPEIDYPTYYVIPKTSFRCSDQLYNPGFYADIETRCQVFHYCYEHRQESFLCPMGTVFNQPILACDYWYSSNCSLAPSYYHANVAKRTEEHFDESDEPLDLPSENLFDKMAHLYEIKNKEPELPAPRKDSDISEIKLLDTDDSESSGEPLIEKNNITDDYNKYSYENRFNMVDEHPEVVKYENIPKGSNEELFVTDNEEDFIFSEDGMLHQSQKDIYRLYPTDMNFNRESGGYAEIKREENFYYDLNDDFEPENDLVSDFDLQKRYADMNNAYVRRPSRKPVMVIPEAEPEIVQLPVVKHRRRKPVGIGSTVSADIESSHITNYDSNIYKEDTVSVANEGLESTTFEVFPLNEPNPDLNNYDLGYPKLLSESEVESSDENGSQLHQTDSSSPFNDYSNQEKNRNAPILSNIDADEISYSVYESGSDDFHTDSNVEDRSKLIDSNNGEESEIFGGNTESSTLHPSETSETTAEEKSSFDYLFLGSGSEENLNQSPLSDVYSFPEDQYIFSDSEGTKITDSGTSYDLPMDVWDTFEGSGIFDQETAGVPNFSEDFDEPIQFVLKEGSEVGVQYGKEPNFSSETFGQVSPLENDGEEFILDGSGESNGFTYLPHQFQESSVNSQDASDKILPEMDGSYYVFSDSELSNYEYDDSNGFSSENGDYAVPENSGDVSIKTTEEQFDNGESRYVKTDSRLRTHYIADDAQHSLDYKDSTHFRNPNEKLSDEFEAETLIKIPEEYITGDSENFREVSTEDIKFLEMMSNNPPPMLQNLFDVSYNESSSYSLKEATLHTEIVLSKQDVNEQASTHKDPASIEAVYELENYASDISSGKEHSADIKISDIEEHSADMKVSDIEDYSADMKISDIEEHSADIEISDTEDHSADVETSDDSETVDTEQIAEDVSNTIVLGEDESAISSTEQNLKSFVLSKEADPFSPQFVESDKILLDAPGSKQKSSLKVSPVKPKISVKTSVIKKDLKKEARGKRFNENFPTFNPPNKGKPMIVPSTETFRENMFTSIPSAFLKMKHSTLSPYFLSYGLKNSGFNPRTGDSFQSSKLSTLTSWGKRLLATKSGKFNTMKKYLDTYRN